MNKMVYTVFIVIMCVTIASILYLVLFGTRNLNGDSLVGTKTGNITQNSEWMGAIWYMAQAVETPIARHYYEYCYLPNIHANDYVDEVLGGHKNNTSYYYDGNMQKTDTDLATSSSNGKLPDLYTFSSSGGVTYYGVDWY